jgi:hypothetical protein
VGRGGGLVGITASFGVAVGVGVCVGVGGSVSVSVGMFSVGVFMTATLLVFGVGVDVVATVELPYAETVQIQRRSATMSVPHPSPIFALRERVRNQCLKPDGLFGGIVYGEVGALYGCWNCEYGSGDCCIVYPPLQLFTIT